MRARTKTLPVDGWPENWQKKWREAFREGTSRYDKKMGTLLHWSPSYRQRVHRGIRLFLDFLEKQDLPKGLPAQDTVEAYLDELLIRKAEGRTTNLSLNTVASYTEELLIAVKTILAPERNWSWLEKVVKQLKQDARHAPGAKKKHKRLVHIKELFWLGHGLLSEARAIAIPNKQAATLFRNGLMILVLTHRAIRLKNLASLTLGQNLILNEDSKTARLEFPAHEMKGRRPYSADISALYAEIQEYLKIYHPLFNCESFWPSKYEKQMAKKYMSTLIGDITERHLGRRLTPHFFRDCLATTLSEEVSGGADHGQIMLQHTDPQITETYRQHASGMASQDAMRDILRGYQVKKSQHPQRDLSS